VELQAPRPVPAMTQASLAATSMCLAGWIPGVPHICKQHEWRGSVKGQAWQDGLVPGVSCLCTGCIIMSGLGTIDHCHVACLTHVSTQVSCFDQFMRPEMHHELHLPLCATCMPQPRHEPPISTHLHVVIEQRVTAPGAVGWVRPGHWFKSWRPQHLAWSQKALLRPGHVQQRRRSGLQRGHTVYMASCQLDRQG
jgi:hypothetical protein